MTPHIPLIAAAMLALLAAACTGGRCRTDAVPRPAAYPRVAAIAAAYHRPDSLPLNIEVNDAAVVSRPGERWLDVAYPTLRATVHITLTPITAATVGPALANRSERMALNVAGAARVTEDTAGNGDFTATVITAPEARNTPVQFVATDGSEWVVSGAAFFGSLTPDAPLDSIAPSLAIVARDIDHLLNSLRHD